VSSATAARKYDRTDKIMVDKIINGLTAPLPELAGVNGWTTFSPAPLLYWPSML
jgi:hypothetical protein